MTLPPPPAMCIPLETVNTICLRGRVLDRVWGPTRDWGYNEWYYLIEPERCVNGTQYLPHWFRESEVMRHYDARWAV